MKVDQKRGGVVCGVGSDTSRRRAGDCDDDRNRRGGRASSFLALLLPALLALTLGAAFLSDQNVVGFTPAHDKIFDAVVVGDSVADVASSRWHRTGDYRSFTAQITISTDCTFWALTGLDTAKLTITSDQYIVPFNGSNPTASSTGFQVDGTNTKQTVLTITAADTSDTTSTPISIAQRFNSTSEPKMFPADFVRFYYTVNDTLADITFTLNLFKQP